MLDWWLVGVEWCSGGELEELLEVICLEDCEEEVEWDLLSFLEFPECE